MKIIQKYKFAVSVFLVMSVLGSCSKYLDVPYPTNSTTTASAFTSKNTIDNMMSNLYILFRDNVELTDLSLSVLPGLAGDAYNPTSSLFADANTNNTSPQGNNLPNWNGFYSTVYNANTMLEGLSTATAPGFTDENKIAYIAAVKTIRAFSYFQLVRLYGNVPLILNTEVTINALLPRTSADSVYAQIEKDLQEAIAILPDAPASKYYIDNKLVPEAILAEVYLTEQKWSEAETLASGIINSGSYQLAAVTDVFLQSSNEGILVTPPIACSANSDNNFKLGKSNYSILFPGGSVYQSIFETLSNALSQDLLNSFEPGDQRLTNWVTLLNAGGYPDDHFRMFCYKYKYSSAFWSDPIPSGKEEEDKIIRLAEIYLLRAEARAHQSNLGGAAVDLNMIRTRAGLGNTTAATQDEIINAVLNERRHELFFEGGYRWFDLVRTGLANTVLSAIPYKTNWKPYMVLFPLYTMTLSGNPNLTQTPGY